MPIDKADSQLEQIVSHGQEFEELGRGYQCAEGPIWYKNEGYLLFSDIFNDAVNKISFFQFL